jgi:hypothetical protein
MPQCSSQSPHAFPGDSARSGAISAVAARLSVLRCFNLPLGPTARFVFSICACEFFLGAEIETLRKLLNPRGSQATLYQLCECQNGPTAQSRALHPDEIQPFQSKAIWSLLYLQLWIIALSDCRVRNKCRAIGMDTEFSFELLNFWRDEFKLNFQMKEERYAIALGT